MINKLVKKIISPVWRRRIKKIIGLQRFDEVEIISAVLRAEKKHGIMIDVGAHYGGSCEEFMRDGWSIFAFEPDPANRKVLESVCKKYNNVSIDKRAVSSKADESIPFYTSSASTGISGLSAFHSSHKETTRVDTIRLDVFCEKENIKKIDFLKIDTEGFDLFVLKSVPWDKLSPDVVLCEFEDKKTKPLGYDYHDQANYLLDKGYTVLVSEWYPIIEYGKRHKWRKMEKYPHDLEEEFAWGNMIAIKQKGLFDKINMYAHKYSEKF